MVQGGENVLFGISRMEGWECVVHSHISVCEDTLPSSFPPIIYCMSHHFCLEAEGAMMTAVTNIAILSQTRIQRTNPRILSM